MWLVEQGVIDPSTVELNEMLLGLVDHLAAMLQHGLLLDELDQQPIAEQIVLVKQLEHADHPYLLDVLDAIAAEHSNHKVARAAKNSAEAALYLAGHAAERQCANSIRPIWAARLSCPPSG